MVYFKKFFVGYLLFIFCLLFILWNARAHDSELFCGSPGINLCFFIIKEPKDFVSANEACRSNGSGLVNIRNSRQFSFVVESMKKSEHGPLSYWIGFYYAADTYQWISGLQAVPFASIRNISQPKECFTLTLPDTYSPPVWSSRPCNTSLPFICEHSLPPQRGEQSVSHGTTLNCPDGFQLFNRSCFYFKENPGISCLLAKRECAAKNAVLASVLSPVQNDYLSVRIAGWSQSAWIGLTIERGEAHWQDNSTVVYTNWLPQVPWTYDLKPSCTLIHAGGSNLGRWQVSNTTATGYVCKANVTHTGVAGNSGGDSLFDLGRCGVGFYNYGTHCYGLLDSSNISAFPSACPGHIVPQSSIGWAIARLALSKHFGIHDGYQVWTGVQMSVKLTSDDFRLDVPTEGGIPYTPTAVDFSAVSLNPPIPTYCLIYDPRRASFSWLECRAKLPTLCIQAIVGNADEVQIPKTSDGKSTCPTDWTTYGATGHRCLSKRVTSASSWFEARDVCRKMKPGSELVTVHSHEDHMFLTNQVGSSATWLGLRVQFFSWNWPSYMLHWADNSPVDYLPNQLVWQNLQVVKNNRSLEQCLCLPWKATSCYDRLPFYCQLDVSKFSKDETVNRNDPRTTTKLCSKDQPPVCFELHAEEKSFFSAVLHCHSRDQVLAMVTSSEHNALIAQLLRQSGALANKRAYIGLSSSSGEFYWVFGRKSLPVTFWNAQLKRSHKGCVFVDAGVTDILANWGITPCRNALPFICSNTTNTRNGTVKVNTQPLTQPRFYNSQCPARFVRVGDNCFLVRAGIKDSNTWDEAAELCHNSNATLASVPSQQDQDALMALLGLESRSAWIGLRYASHTYSWVRGDPVNFVMLADDDSLLIPSACIAMRFDQLGHWSGFNCSLRMGYICQTIPTPVKRDDQVASTEVLLLQQGACRDDYFAYRDQCYRFLNKSNLVLNFSQARLLCLNNQPSEVCDPKNSPNKWATADCPVVATPHSQVDAAYLRHLVHTLGKDATTWLGVRLVVTPGKEQVLTEDNFPLVTGILDFSNYNDLVSVANKRNVHHLCTVAFNSSTQISLTACDSGTHAVVCSYYQFAHESHPSQVLNCPPGWKISHKKCYSTTNGDDSKKSWTEAEQACQALAANSFGQNDAGHYVGHLPSLHAPEEMDHLLPFSAWGPEAWTGLKIHYGGPRQSPVGLSHVKPAGLNLSLHMSWSDHSPVDYIPVSPADMHLDDRDSGEKCALLVSLQSGHALKLVDCDEPRQFHCQLSVSTDVPHCHEIYRHKTRSHTASVCYHMAQVSLSWFEANAICRSLTPPGHLASLHSEQQLAELVELVTEYYEPGTDIWLGLYESQFAYQWSDGSPTNFIPMETDESKTDRHLVQDCFVLSSTKEHDRTHSFLWRAVNCSEHKAAVVCQPEGGWHLDKSISTDPVTTSLPSPTPGTASSLLSCPAGFYPFLDRCFILLNEGLTWLNADRRCKEFVGGARSEWSGSLAKIDSLQIQEFVSSLLDNLPTTYSAAWIGLVRNLTEDHSRYHWSDGGSVSYVRPTFSIHDGQPIFDQQHAIQFCIALSRSTYPRLNGLWLPMECNVNKLPAVCQSKPKSINTKVASKGELPFTCPTDFVLSTTGQAGNNSVSLTVCYRLLNSRSSAEHKNWEASQRACSELSTPDHPVTALIITSVYEVQFLRAWLGLPDHGGVGLINGSTQFWTALNVPPTCPACYANWSWTTGRSTEEPVRYTDWLVAPTPTPSGCYVFDSNPYSRSPLSPTVDVGMGSMRPENCKSGHAVVCQTPAHRVNTADKYAPRLHQSTRPICSTVIGNSGAQHANRMTSVSGKPCIRWDVVSTANLTNFHLDVSFQRLHMSMSDRVGGHAVRSYAENYCSFISGESHEFSCYVSSNPPTLEPCHFVKCDGAPTQAAGVFLSSWLTAAILMLLVTGALTLAVGTWRGCAPFRAGYQHQLPSDRKDRHTPVFFTPQRDALMRTTDDNSNVNAVGGASSAPRNGYLPVSMQFGGPRPPVATAARLGANSTESNYHRSSTELGSTARPPIVRTSILNSMAYYNPAYAPLNAAPDDLYDPDEEM